MTVTETEAPVEKTSVPALQPPPPATGVAAVLGSGDHKTIGRLWIFTSFLYLVLAGVLGAIAGIEKIDVGDIDILDADVFAQSYSLHAVAGVFLFLVPVFLGLATYVVPLQVGSSSVAFPRAAAAAYWTYLVSGGIIIAAYVADGGPFGGDTDSVELFVAGMIALLAALSLAAVCIATTAIALRAPGMGLHRAPLFTWANLVWASLLLLTLPLLAGVLLLVYVDLRYGPTFLGGSGQVFARIAWAWSQPSVYVFAIPVLGIVGDIVPVAAQTRLTMHRIAMLAIGAYGVFSFGAWAMPGFAPRNSPELSLDHVGELPFMAFSVIVLVELLAFTGLLGDTIVRGKVRILSPLLWGLGALVMLLAGAANGVLVSVDPLDLMGTTAQASQIHYVLVASLLGAFAGLAWWSPKLFGTEVAEGPSKGLAGLGLIGTVLLCLPDLVAGFLDQAWRLGGASDDIGSIEALNVVSLAGGALVTLTALAMVGLVAQAAFGRDNAGDDPWTGHTLEWAAGSPPDVGNFTEVPRVTSEAPLYDARHRAAEEAAK